MVVVEIAVGDPEEGDTVLLVVDAAVCNVVVSAFESVLVAVCVAGQISLELVSLVALRL